MLLVPLVVPVVEDEEVVGYEGRGVVAEGYDVNLAEVEEAVVVVAVVDIARTRLKMTVGYIKCLYVKVCSRGGLLKL